MRFCNCRVDDIQLIQDDSMVYRVSSSGQVEWSSPGVFKIFCTDDVTYFPYDIQTCYISKKQLTTSIFFIISDCT